MDTFKRLNSVISDRGISLYALSKLADINYNTLKSGESRGGQLSVNTIEIICRALGITMSEFFSEENTEGV